MYAGLDMLEKTNGASQNPDFSGNVRVGVCERSYQNLINIDKGKEDRKCGGSVRRGAA